MPFLSTLFIAVLLTVLMIPALSMLAVRLQMLDVPDARKVHAMPIPRCGGIAMALGALAPIFFWYSGNPFILSFLVAVSIILFFGIADDCLELSPGWKLFGQLIAALVVIYWGGVKIVYLGALLPEGVLLPGGISLPLTVLVIVGVTNAVNLSDGLDGLAGGIILLVVCCLGYLAYLVGNAEIALACLALAGAIFGFLRFNTHPATIFMGDSGSQLLGFSAVTLSLALTQQERAFSALIPLLFFGLPVLDTLTVMTTRILRGNSPFTPDRSHVHHRLLEMGLSHAASVIIIYLLQAFLVLLTFSLRFQSEWLFLTCYLLFSLGIFVFFHYADRVARWQKCHPVFVRVKSWFRTVQARRRVQMVSFAWLKCFLYSLMVLSSLFTPRAGRFPALLLAAEGGAILLMRRVRPEVLARVIRTVFYPSIPFVVYSGDADALRILGSVGDWLFSATFVLLLLAGIVISVFSTRQQGFRSTPLDFLILFLVLVVAMLPDINSLDHRLGLVGLKCIIFYVSFEVLMAEMRGKVEGVLVVTALSLFVYASKSFCS